MAIPHDHSSCGWIGRFSGRVLEILFQHTAFRRPARFALAELVGKDSDVPAYCKRFVAEVQAMLEFAASGSVEFGGSGQALASASRATCSSRPRGLANSPTPRFDPQATAAVHQMLCEVRDSLFDPLFFPLGLQLDSSVDLCRIRVERACTA